MNINLISWPYFGVKLSCVCHREPVKKKRLKIPHEGLCKKIFLIQINVMRIFEGSSPGIGTRVSLYLHPQVA